MNNKLPSILNTTFKDTITHLQQKVARRGINYSLDRLNNALSILNHPHQNLPTTFHIAGTNGKGSVAHYLTQALIPKETVITYTSPHIHSYTERILINGVPISEDEFCQSFHYVNQADEDDALSEYEILTLMAFHIVSTYSPSIFILETGLGGRLDATNIIPNSIAIITDIGLDHMDILGNSISEIAKEKSGIIKPNTTLITHENHHPDAMKVVMDTAKQQQATVKIAKSADSFINRNQSLALTALSDYLPSQHQYFASIIAQIPPPFGRLTKTNYNQTPCWIDVGHNINAIQAIFSYLQSQGGSNYHWILGMQIKKNPLDVIEWLLSKNQPVSYCNFNSSYCYAYQELPMSIQSNISEWDIGDKIPNNTIFFGSFFFIEALGFNR